MATYDSDRFHVRRTASGARYDKNDKNAYSAAHKTLPLEQGPRRAVRGRRATARGLDANVGPETGP